MVRVVMVGCLWWGGCRGGIRGGSKSGGVRITEWWGSRGGRRLGWGLGHGGCRGFRAGAHEHLDQCFDFSAQYSEKSIWNIRLVD